MHTPPYTYTLHLHTYTLMPSQRHLPRYSDVLIHQIKVQCLHVILPSYYIICKYYLNFLFTYLVILEETFVSIYLPKYLTKSYSTCLLSFLVSLWVVKLTRSTTTTLRNAILWNIVAQNLCNYKRFGVSALTSFCSLV